MITDTQLAALKQELEGSCLLLDVALERLEIDASAEEAEDRLLDGQGSIERSSRDRQPTQICAQVLQP